LQQLVTSDPIPSPFADDSNNFRPAVRGPGLRRRDDDRRFQKIVLFVILKQRLDRRPERRVGNASPVQKSGLLVGRWPFEGLEEEFAFCPVRFCLWAVHCACHSFTRNSARQSANYFLLAEISPTDSASLQSGSRENAAKDK